MSNFKVDLLPITVVPHPGADALELALVGPPETAYRCVVGKGMFKTGDLVAYIPEASILPDALIESMGLVGRLAGSSKNRVKAVKLRGALSEGLVWAPKEGWRIWFAQNNPNRTSPESAFTDAEAFAGEDIAVQLGITKYQPVIPATMSGNMVGDAPAFAAATDMDNFKKYSHILERGETVYATEKIHGTQCSLIYDGHTLKVSSKGVLTRNRATLAEDPHNLYWQVVRDCDLDTSMKALYQRFDTTVQLVGEIYGDVQDLKYGLSQGKRAFAAFDIRICNPDNTGSYIDSVEFFYITRELGIPTVPLLYIGNYFPEMMQEFTDGLTHLGGGHLREGVVIKPAIERTDYLHGRVILKSVSEAYLLRKGNVTELE